MERKQAQITKFLKLMMVATGTWRHKLTNNKLTQSLYNLYSVFFQVSFLCFVFALILNFPLLLKKQDFQVMIEYVGYTILMFMMLIKTIMAQSSEIRNLIFRCIMEEIRMYKEDSQRIQSNFEKNVKVLNRIILVVLVISFSAIFVFCDVKYIEYIEHKDLNISFEKPMVFPLWYPFNANKYYGTAFAIAMYFSLLTIFNVVCTQVLFYTLMTYAALQIKALKINALEYHLDYEPYNTALKYNEEKHIIRVLRDICVKHQSIISFVDALKIAIKNVLLLEFILNSFNIASVMLQIIILPNTPLMRFQSVLFFLVQVYQLFLICWLANEIQLQSMALSDKLFQSKWYDQSENAKKIIYIIMLRSRKPLSVFIGPFYPMTSRTALSTLKAAYSYVAMICTLAAKEQVT